MAGKRKEHTLPFVMLTHVDDETFAWLKERATQEERKISDIIRRIVQAARHKRSIDAEL